MIREILTEAGVEFDQGHFIRKPQGTYAVYFDDVDLDGPDRESVILGQPLPAVCTHNVRIELYEPARDDKAEADLERAILSRGLTFSKEDRYWLSDALAYQVIYELTYTDKL